MDTLTIILIVLILLTSATIGALIIWQLAKHIGKIEQANFKNSFVISTITTLLILGIKYLLISMSSWAHLSYAFKMIGNFIIITLVYAFVSKLIWKCSFKESFITTIIWSIISTGLFIFSTY